MTGVEPAASSVTREEEAVADAVGCSTASASLSAAEVVETAGAADEEEAGAADVDASA